MFSHTFCLLICRLNANTTELICMQILRNIGLRRSCSDGNNFDGKARGNTTGLRLRRRVALQSLRFGQTDASSNFQGLGETRPRFEPRPTGHEASALLTRSQGTL